MPGHISASGDGTDGSNAAEGSMAAGGDEYGDGFEPSLNDGNPNRD